MANSTIILLRDEFAVSTLKGSVIEIDSSGNLVTDIAFEKLANAPSDTSLRVVIDEHETFGLFPPEHSQPSMTLIAVRDPQSSLKIVLVDDSASSMLGVRVGAPVEVHW